MFGLRLQQPAAFYLLMTAIAVRLFVPAEFLDLFYDYDLVASGSPLLKIHPGTYLIFVSAAMAAQQRATIDGKIYVQVAALIGALAPICLGWGFLHGSTVSVGFILDAYLATAAACFALSRMPETDREAILPVICAVMTANCLLCFGEAVTHLRLMPYRFSLSSGETIFRPTGILNHPLINGLYICTTIPFLMLLRTSLFNRLALAAMFAAATFASEARVATLVAAPVWILSNVLAARRGGGTSVEAETARLMQTLIGIVMIPLVVILAIAAGLGQRLTAGLIDQSSNARLDVYGMLAYLTPQELMQGVGLERQNLIIALRSGPTVESPLVELTFLFGLPIAVIFLTATAGVLVALCRRASLLVWIGATAFVAVAATNNGLSTKTPEMLFIVTLVAASRRRSVVATSAAERQARAPVLASGAAPAWRGALAARQALAQQRLSRRPPAKPR